MPWIRLNFGFDNVPFAQITNCARITSSRSVPTTQHASSSFHTVDVTVVWKTARS